MCTIYPDYARLFLPLALCEGIRQNMKGPGTVALTMRHRGKDRIQLGANPQASGAWDFLVWAPRREKVSLHLIGASDRLISMTADRCGYHHVTEKNVQPHSRYLYRFGESREYPDPASRFQPDGVHLPSQIVDLTAFRWSDSEWTPPSLE